MCIPTRTRQWQASTRPCGMSESAAAARAPGLFGSLDDRMDSAIKCDVPRWHSPADGIGLTLHVGADWQSWRRRGVDRERIGSVSAIVDRDCGGRQPVVRGVDGPW